MNEAMTAGFVRPKSDRRAGGYGFTHERIAEVLIEAPAREGLRDLHRRMAHALVSRSDRAAGEIAVHYHLARSTGLAYEHARKAAVEAEHVYAVSAGGKYLDLAIQNSASAAELADVRVQLAHLSEIRGRYDEVEELCDLAIEWYDSQRDVRRALSVRRLRERARIELGQPARVTLNAIDELSAQARDLGLDDEAVALNILASLTYTRLGDGRKAERLANEAVEMAEALNRRDLVAESKLRLGVCLAQDSPKQARPYLEQAMEAFESLGDIRGQARAQNSFAVLAMFEGKTSEAGDAFEQAISMAKTAGMPDIAGVAALNLATQIQKTGDYARAKELFADSLTSFSDVRNSAYQVAALFNMAHCEREEKNWQAALELYSTTSSLAERIGLGDVEVGSIAGAGLCHLELDQIEEAQKAAAEVKARLARRPEWFQNREIAEALVVLIDLRSGATDAAFDRFEVTARAADLGDPYTAIWLTLTCAAELNRADVERSRTAIEHYYEASRKLGFPAVTRRFNGLLNVTEEGVR
jgi:tetratricopeptide (TPR) repeat protein